MEIAFEEIDATQPARALPSSGPLK